ncbi:TIGR03667 family PPOX class F420-dependent oxidoreductase [Pseudonocardia humida]|uniref:TIGR03667 family PPOX class F420-dependent oxidoreductase n=1 Tax=Pseudonocardia humida TaxID=2800819 RepID=A0ABT1A2J8_9PSEU|nr:TIGR03667 family PPOX class F420-dependent oxidoreductase [Pseudonocardia humida]MCO1657238.1 TIGR03667 family PPOX class F420-dependent oxidoreductase [Pseudonocardia humida]
MTVLPDTSTEFGSRVERRLRDEVVAWMTLVDPGGSPQPAPIWFLWDGATALVNSDRNAKRLTHLRRNPKVALHLDGDGRGGDIVVLTGEVVVDATAPAPPDNQPYLAKYGEQITGGLWGTAEVFAQTYNVALRFTPHRVRGH